MTNVREVVIDDVNVTTASFAFVILHVGDSVQIGSPV